jgi:hypothetical protein
MKLHSRYLVAALSLLTLLTIQLFADNDTDLEISEGVFEIGDAKAGRQAFIDLKCVTCHQVKNDPELPKPVAGRPGPLLANVRAYHTVGKLADTMVSPAHVGIYLRMGDYSKVMTVGQLFDIVAYFNSLREASEAGSQD